MRLLERYDGPQGLRRAGKKRIMEWAGKIKYQKKRGPALVEEVFETLERLTVLLPATEIIEIQIKKIAKRILELEEEKKELNAAIAERAEMIPEVAILCAASQASVLYTGRRLPPRSVTSAVSPTQTI